MLIADGVAGTAATDDEARGSWFVPESAEERDRADAIIQQLSLCLAGSDALMAEAAKA